MPFEVVTSQQTINGENVPAGVYMDTAFIKNGSITNAFIGDAAIDNAKISVMSADKLNAGTINAATSILRARALTALNIKSSRRQARGPCIPPQGIEIYDATGLRVKIGLL